MSLQTSDSNDQIANDPELLNDFVLESRDHLSNIENQVLVLEQNPLSTEALHSIFRSFHTIKGLAGFLEISAIQEVAHEVETLLDLARDGKLAVTSVVIDRVLESKDYLGTGIEIVESSIGSSSPALLPATAHLVERIRQLTIKDSEMKVVSAKQNSDAVAPDVARDLQLLNAQLKDQKPTADNKEADPPAVAASQASQHEARSIKVDTAKLDYLVDMVGEMVIAQSLIRHEDEGSANSSSKINRHLSHLARVTNEVQRTAMALRMVPIKGLFQRMTRLVRDLSKRTGKTVDLVLQGEDTELDRNIVEELGDPLMHMVRNAVDHGIEGPADRTAAGKDSIAKLFLSASHQGGQMVIAVGDDGRGLNKDRILAKARQNGVISEGATLSDDEVFRLIFAPGFSTAEKITDVSGRGVGMDVVKQQIEKLRGRIDIKSVQGEGTTFFLHLPLTLAIIEGLIVAVGRERFILPISPIYEMLRPDSSMIFTVENKGEMALIRGSLLPIVRLHKKLNIKTERLLPSEGVLVVIECFGKKICLLVDELIGKQEVVVKSLGQLFRHVHFLAGGAVLGDGRVGLVIDVERLMRNQQHA